MRPLECLGTTSHKRFRDLETSFGDLYQRCHVNLWGWLSGEGWGGIFAPQAEGSNIWPETSHESSPSWPGEHVQLQMSTFLVRYLPGSLEDPNWILNFNLLSPIAKTGRWTPLFAGGEVIVREFDSGGCLRCEVVPCDFGAYEVWGRLGWQTTLSGVNHCVTTKPRPLSWALSDPSLPLQPSLTMTDDEESPWQTHVWWARCVHHFWALD